MALKTFKPITPGLRQLVLVDRSELYKGKPVKALTEGKTSPGGRNNLGRITVRFRGGGHKRTLPHRRLQAPRSSDDAGDGRADRVRSEPHRLHRADQATPTASWPTSWRRSASRSGDQVVAGEQVDVKPGNAMPLGNMPVGTIIHNVEMKIGKGGAIARSAGTYAQIVGRDQGYVTLRLNSGEQRLVHGQCFATVGAVSNPDHMNISIGKAGRNRWLGKRPHNRGVAMNPIDHPHGGGEGRTSGGRHPVTPWGKPTKGKKTRSNKRTDKFIVSSRHAARRSKG